MIKKFYFNGGKNLLCHLGSLI